MDFILREHPPCIFQIAVDINGERKIRGWNFGIFVWMSYILATALFMASLQIFGLTYVSV